MDKPNADVKTTFKETVNQRLALHPNQWNGEDSVEVVRNIVTSLDDGHGNMLSLTPEDEAVIKLASQPTLDGQMSVIRTIVGNHNAKLDPTAESLIRKVVSPPAFKLELTKAGKIKDTSTSGLQDLLA